MVHERRKVSAVGCVREKVPLEVVKHALIDDYNVARASHTSRAYPTCTYALSDGARVLIVLFTHLPTPSRLQPTSWFLPQVELDAMLAGDLHSVFIPD